jgi:hypothetical protein
MTTKSTISLAEAYQGLFSFRVYGRPLADTTSAIDLIEPAANRAAAKLAMIRAFRYGETCRRLPLAVPLYVWGAGNKPQSDDRCADPTNADELYWDLPADAQSVSLDIQRGSIAELLDQATTRGIDGGLQIENPRFENGKLCATVHAWARISIFGHNVGFDERIHVCIPLEGCYPIWSIEIAKIEACFRAPSELCIKLCVGKWGLEKCWDACAHIPLPAPAALAASAAMSPALQPQSCGCSH